MLRRATPRLFALVGVLLMGTAFANPFPCPDLMYEEVSVEEVNGYRIVHRGFPDYRTIIIELVLPDGTSWCWDTPGGQSVMLSQRGMPPHFDVNGNGITDIMITVYGFSNGCDESFYLVELDQTPRILYLKEHAEYKQRGDDYEVCDHWVQDVDHDGVYELLTFERAMGCSTATTARVPVVMAWVADRGYVVADPYASGPQFKPYQLQDVYASLVGGGLMWFAEALAASSEESAAHEAKCLLPLVLLPIIYQGNMELARTTLELLYRFEDREEFWQEVVGAASRSAYLNVPGPGVDR